ncbi:hypothetical protein EDWATA_02767 [Edwardsiella tarda ATCC 23685]|uniref:Uncharacterized protein n=1 Tax=Edwardsiella tarda ATCC 23685 TaxID=500638 RepID=D4F7N0_EDWTA|nr:hypothetical protein EDWATA_02767 [Edwardsiella tarda ATCC 23685]
MVPATIKILPIVRFFTLSSALLLQGVISAQRTGNYYRRQIGVTLYVIITLHTPLG